MSYLPPLANLIAVREQDPAALSQITEKIRASGVYTHIWHPHPQWVVAMAYLPDSEPDPASAQASGLAFVQGRDEIELGPDNLHTRFQQVAGLTQNSPQSLAQLPGDFGYLQFATGGSVNVVRAAGGLVPLYCWHTPARSAIGTQLHNLVRFAYREATLDPLTCATWLGGGWPIFINRRSFLRDVYVVGRGEVCHLRPGQPLAYTTYWRSQPDRYPRYSKQKEVEHVEEFREILFSTLKKNLHPDGGNVLSLSGGVDSSSLAAVIKGHLGFDLWTWSFLPPPGPDLDRELGYINPLLDGLDIKRRWQLTVTDEAYELLEQHRPKTLYPGTWSSVCGLGLIAKEAQPRVFITGHLADEMCGSAFTTPDWALSLSPLQLLRRWGRYPRGPKDILSWCKYRLRQALRRPTLHYSDDLLEYIQPALREEYRAWRREHYQRIAAGNWAWQYFVSRIAADGWLANLWENTTVLNVRPLFPFFTRHILELHARCHPAELVGPGTKCLLRNALRDCVPKLNLDRPDKGRWTTLKLEEQLPKPLNLREECSEVIDASHFPSAQTLWPKLAAKSCLLLNSTSQALHNIKVGTKQCPFEDNHEHQQRTADHAQVL